MLTAHEVVVEGATIRGVYPSGSVDHPADAAIVELPGSTLLPGLIDVHCHYTIDWTRDDAISSGGSDPAEQCVLVGARNARIALASGVTTARSAGASRGLDIALAAAIDRGDVPGPRLLAAGPAITITGGHGMHFGLQADGVDGLVAALRTVVRDGAQVVKLVASEAAMLTGANAAVPELAEPELVALVAEARRLRRRVLAHAQSSQAVVAAARAGVDSVEHAFLADDAALEVVAAAGCFLTPTLTVTDIYASLDDLPAERRERQRVISVAHRRSCEQAIRLGIPLAAGTDCGVPAVAPDVLWREVWLLHDHGLGAMDAVHAATSSAARLLGLDDVGTIEEGNAADLLVVDGDPMADLRRLADVRMVVKAGRIVRDERDRR